MGWGIDDVGEVFEDIADVPGDIVEAAASMFEGPGGVAGIFVSGAALYVGGPSALVPALIEGIAVTEGLNALIKTRGLSAEERTLAEMVFGNNLPYDKILLTNLGHPQGRAFVIPNAAGQCLVNLGTDYYDPIRATKGGYPEHGQLLIHELTHTWQIAHSKFVPGLICEGIISQIRNELEEGVYDPGVGGRNWWDYNLEQQGTIVDRWYWGWIPAGGNTVARADGGGCSPKHPFYRYVLELNGGTHPPAVQRISVKDVAHRKFNTSANFSISNRFPRVVKGPRSLRKALIGLNELRPADQART